MIAQRLIRAADLFCGAGGSSTGMAQACDEFGVNLQLSAVNHWNVAIATHERNHPNAQHKCANVDEIRLAELAPAGVDVLWASPSCTEHSYAKGGCSIDDQKRASAWAIPRAIEAWRPKIVIVENVRPFLNWGPVAPVINRRTKRQAKDKHGNPLFRPIKSRKGETFRAWVTAIESLGYAAKWDLLNAADYGEAQSRLRLFVVFTAVDVDFEFPAPSHGKAGTLEVERGLRLPWVGSKKAIDFKLPMQSIFERQRPLSKITISRIAGGIVKYCSREAADVFLVVLRQHADALSVDEPSPTVAASGTHLALAQLELRPFVLGQHGGGVARSTDMPASTISTDGFVRLIQPYLVKVTGSLMPGETPDKRVKSIDQPAGAVTSKNGLALVEIGLKRAYEHNERLVVVDGEQYVLDVRFRMLEPFELARLQGFPDDYAFEGGRAAQTKQIGNAVPVRVARALMLSALRAIHGDELMEAVA